MLTQNTAATPPSCSACLVLRQFAKPGTQNVVDRQATVARDAAVGREHSRVGDGSTTSAYSNKYRRKEKGPSLSSISSSLPW